MLEYNSNKMRKLKPSKVPGCKHCQNIARAIHLSLLFNFLYLSFGFNKFSFFSPKYSLSRTILTNIFIFTNKEISLELGSGFWAYFILGPNPHLKGLMRFIHLTTPSLFNLIASLFLSPLWLLYHCIFMLSYVLKYTPKISYSNSKLLKESVCVYIYI